MVVSSSLSWRIMKMVTMAIEVVWLLIDAGYGTEHNGEGKLEFEKLNMHGSD